MLQNHFKIAIRNLLRNKSQSAILIGGLTAGMAACILLLQYVSFELSYDDFHTKKDNIYRVVNERLQNGESTQKGTITYPTIGPTMVEEFPEVKNATRLAYSTHFMITQGDKIAPVEPGLWVDEHFFEIFDFNLLASDDLNVLDEPNEVVLTRQLADRYFPAAKGNYDLVVGQDLKVDRYEEAFQVVGVCENVPANSLLQFEMLVSYASTFRYWGEGANNSWNWSDFYHYIELEPNTDVAGLEAKFTDFSQRHFRGTEVTRSEEIFTLQPLSEAHLYSENLEYEIGQTANGRAVWSLLIIAFFILLIAWINYVNLSSVRAIERAKEVGVRKVIGATRGQLVVQFLMEALAVNVVSLFLALSAVQLIKPWFAANFGVDVATLAFLSGSHISEVNIYLILALGGLILMGVIISGIYPAWLLSSPHVSNVLKGVFSKNIGSKNLRKGLVIFQFAISIALIAATWLVSHQIRYMSQQDLGIDIDQVMIVNPPELTQWDSTFINRTDAFKAAVAQLPNVNSASTSSRTPGETMGRVFHIEKLGENADETHYTSNFINVDFEYAKTYQLEPLTGRFFRQNDHNMDWDLVDKVVLNEAAVEMLGYTNNEKAIDQSISFYNKNWRIVGVVPNFHQRSLHHSIEPIILIPSYSTGNMLSLDISSNNMEQTIAQVKSLYLDFFPGNGFEFSFMNERFQRLYEADLRFGNILSFFTLLTILIACFGLFGLASYTTFLRTKEIGIRKVLGASSASIVALLSKDFLKLVVIAILIATPLAWYMMDIWLENFAYRIDIPWWVFVITGVATVAIAFGTVSFQSVKVALGSPVESLRSE